MTKAVKLPDISENDIELITPEKAKIYLKGNSQNRPLKKFIVQRYAELMKEGHWRINGEAIKFDTEGNLLDGQHRLYAVIEAGVNIETYVIRDLSRDVFDTLDTGRTRTGGDAMALKGVKNYTVVATVLRLLIFNDVPDGILQYGQHGRNISNQLLVDTYARHPKVIESADFIIGAGVNKFMAPGLAAFCHYIFSQIDRNQADVFFLRFVKGANLQEGDPVLALKNKMLNFSVRSSKDRLMIIAITMKAWNFQRRNKTVSLLKWQAGEDFPHAI